MLSIILYLIAGFFLLGILCVVGTFVIDLVKKGIHIITFPFKIIKEEPAIFWGTTIPATISFMIGGFILLPIVLFFEYKWVKKHIKNSAKNKLKKDLTVLFENNCIITSYDVNYLYRKYNKELLFSKRENTYKDETINLIQEKLGNRQIISCCDSYIYVPQIAKTLNSIRNVEFITADKLIKKLHISNLHNFENNLIEYLDKFKDIVPEFSFVITSLEDGRHKIFVRDDIISNHTCDYCHCFVEKGVTKNNAVYCSQTCLDADTKLLSNPPLLLKSLTTGAISTSLPDQLAVKSMENTGIANAIAKQKMFHTPQGHGFAGEESNTLYDKHISGKDAKVIGYDNAKNGADRLVGRTEIQSKYCRSGKACIDACYDENGSFKYINSHGKTMKIEVPLDKYSEAVKVMKKKISEGKVPGHTNPQDAYNIVRKGHFTYEQTKNMTHFCTIESIGFDATQGAVIGAQVGSFSAVLSFAEAVWQGKDLATALKSSVTSGGKAFISTEVATIATGQIIKTEFGREVNTMAMRKISAIGLSRILGDVAPIGAAVQVAIMSFKDFCKILDGKLSGGELLHITLENAAKVAGSMAGGFAGGMAGAALASTAAGTAVSGAVTSVASGLVGRNIGAAIGSGLLPGIGTVVGGILGGLVVSSILGDDKKSKELANQRKEQEEKIQELNSQIQAMYPIFRDRFSSLGRDYILTKNETIDALTILQNNNLPARLLEMYRSSNKLSYATSIIRPCIIDVISKRNTVDPFEEISTEVVFN